MKYFSLICATYNREKTIERMILSVIKQNYTKWELSHGGANEKFIPKDAENLISNIIFD